MPVSLLYLYSCIQLSLSLSLFLYTGRSFDLIIPYNIQTMCQFDVLCCFVVFVLCSFRISPISHSQTIPYFGTYSCLCDDGMCVYDSIGEIERSNKKICLLLIFHFIRLVRWFRFLLVCANRHVDGTSGQCEYGMYLKLIGHFESKFWMDLSLSHSLYFGTMYKTISIVAPFITWHIIFHPRFIHGEREAPKACI